MTDNLPAVMSFDNMQRLAESVAKSGMFGMKTTDQALVLMAIAQAEGRHPALAARDYHIIQNTPAKKAEAMLRDFQLAGGRVEWHELTDEAAEATFSHPQGGSVKLRWDMKRMAQAGISNPMYRKYPRQMLRSRLISEGARTVYPAATGGMYAPEEVGDMEREPPLNVTPEKVANQVDSWRNEREGKPTETTWADVGNDVDALIAQGNVACRDPAMLEDWWKTHLRPEQRAALGATRGRGVGPYLPGWKEGEIQERKHTEPTDQLADVITAGLDAATTPEDVDQLSADHALA